MANNYLQQAKEIMEGKTSVRVLGYGKFAVPEFFTLYKDNIGIYSKDNQADNGKYYIENWKCDYSYQLVAVDNIADLDDPNPYKIVQ